MDRPAGCVVGASAPRKLCPSGQSRRSPWGVGSRGAHRLHLLNPRTPFASGWHFEVIAAKLAAVRVGHVRRLIVNVPPRHLKSHLASVAFPAWCLGHESGLQILCVSYAQDLADKLSRDCRHIVAGDPNKATELSDFYVCTTWGSRARTSIS